MKKNLFFVIASSMAIASGFTACSSDNDSATIDPHANSAGKTTIAFGVSGNGSTRMADAETQQDNSFGGIKNVDFWSFYQSGLSNGSVAGGDADFVQDITGIDEISAYDQNATAPNSNGGVKVFKNLTLPVNNFGDTRYIFYGENKLASTTTNVLTRNYSAGGMTGKKLSAIEFSLKQRASGTSGSATIASLQTALSAVFAEMEANRAAQAALGTPQGTDNATRLAADLATFKATNYSASLEALDYIINFIDGEYRNVSIATANRTALDAIATLVSGTTLQLKSDFRGFIGTLPRCLCMLHVDASNNATITTNTDAVNNLSGVTAGFDSYTYAPSLWYYGNGWLTKQTAGSAPTNWEGTYTTYANATTVANPAVDYDLAYSHPINYGEALLHASILNNITIQPILYDPAYATGDAEVRCGTNPLTGYRWESYTGTGSSVVPGATALTAGQFYLTGILIGMQPQKVGYDFTQASLAAAPAVKTVYDDELQGATNVNVAGSYGNSYTYKAVSVPATASGTALNVYTLLLETAVATATSKVNFALEFVNNSGKTFVGNNAEVVKPGSTFYLVGTIDWTGKTGSVTGVDKIFQQDYTTLLNINIKALKAFDKDGTNNTTEIYTTVPDLLTAEHSIAMYIDVVWKAGYSYSIDLGK